MNAEWMDAAACRDYDPEWWYADKKADAALNRAAKDVCRTCPVQPECLADADGHGIRAGLDAKQRNRIAQGKPATRVLAPCGTTSAYKRHRENGTPTCEPCRAAMRVYNAANWAARSAVA